MVRTTTTEGHYTIKRVDQLPKKGNANWLYILRAPTVGKLYRWDSFDKEWEVIILQSQTPIPEDTNLEFDTATNTLSATFTDGTLKSVTLTGLGGNNTPQTLELTGTNLAISEGNYVDLVSLMSTVGNTSELINDSGFITTADIPDETLTSLTISGSTLNYTDESGTTNSLNLPTTSEGGGISSVVAGTNIIVNSTDPNNPIINSIAATGLETIDEGNGNGWRLIGMDPSSYGDIGFQAVDLTMLGDGSSGATGRFSFAANLRSNSSGFASASFNRSEASGGYSFSGGFQTQAFSLFETAFGFFSTEYTPTAILRGVLTDLNTTDPNDRVFNIGNGNDSIDRRDAFTILRDGRTGIGINNFEETLTDEKLQINGKIKATSINFTGLPTSSVGLSPGDVWNDLGTLKIV